MSPEERDEFEEHFFSCRVCGEDVYAASLFKENARAVFGDQSLKIAPAAKRSWNMPVWLGWLRLEVAAPAFAAIVLGVFTGYQNLVTIPELRVPRSLASPVIFDGGTRAAETVKAPAGKPLRFETMLVRPAESGHVLVEIVDGAGNTVRSGAVDSPGLDQPLDVYFPGSLSPGRYTLIARTDRGGNAGQELARDQFEVTPKGE